MEEAVAILSSLNGILKVKAVLVVSEKHNLSQPMKKIKMMTMSLKFIMIGITHHSEER